MNLLAFFKTSVAIMTILLLAGFTFIIYKLSDKNFQSKLKTKNIAVQTEQTLTAKPLSESTSSKTNRFLNTDEDIFSILNCDKNLCITVKNKTDNYRLLVINPQSGMLVTEIFLK